MKNLTMLDLWCKYFKIAYFTLKKYISTCTLKRITLQLMFSFTCLFSCIILDGTIYLIEELRDVKQRWYLPWPYGNDDNEKTVNHWSLNDTLLTINNVKKCHVQGNIWSLINVTIFSSCFPILSCCQKMISLIDINPSTLSYLPQPNDKWQSGHVSIVSSGFFLFGADGRLNTLTHSSVNP